MSILLLALLLSMHGRSLPAPPIDTVYVASTGSKLFLNSGAQIRDYVVLSIETRDEATRAIQYLSASSAAGSQKYQALLSLLLREGCGQ